MRFALTSELAGFISARIANYLTEATEPHHRDEAQDVTKFAALPLIRHWFETIAIRADGEIVKWSTDERQAFLGAQPVESRYDWLSALVEGARRYAELRELLPVRPPNATACHCTGREVKYCCLECCGLGWIEGESH